MTPPPPASCGPFTLREGSQAAGRGPDPALAGEECQPSSCSPWSQWLQCIQRSTGSFHPRGPWRHTPYTSAHWEGHAGKVGSRPHLQAHRMLNSLPSALPELSAHGHNLQMTEAQWGRTAGVEVGAQGRHLGSSLRASGTASWRRLPRTAHARARDVIKQSSCPQRMHEADGWEGV